MATLARVQLSRIDTTAVAQLDGEIDLSNAGEIYDEIANAVGSDDLALVVDLTRVTYLDSSAMRLLLRIADALRRNRQQIAVVVAPHGIAKTVLDVTGVGAQYPYHHDVAAALYALGHPAAE